MLESEIRQKIRGESVLFLDGFLQESESGPKIGLIANPNLIFGGQMERSSILLYIAPQRQLKTLYRFCGFFLNKFHY